jgi:hypothetical protein
MSKHKTSIEKNQVFEFDKLTTTNPLEYHRIEKPKEVIKKTKLLNKNSKIYEYLFEQKIENNNNNNNNSQDIFDPKNMEYYTSIIPSP